ncbi:MAG: hypothetical protein M1834_007497 [Cirrosporium novae-zelandiae]|nr:MAG: hypothetical protein M1834_007497 [Cirrosporium novae-zelandiae]
MVHAATTLHATQDVVASMVIVDLVWLLDSSSDYCSDDYCLSDCDRKSECDAGWGSEWSESEDCPLNELPLIFAGLQPLLNLVREPPLITVLLATSKDGTASDLVVVRDGEIPT